MKELLIQELKKKEKTMPMKKMGKKKKGKDAEILAFTC